MSQRRAALVAAGLLLTALAVLALAGPQARADDAPAPEAPAVEKEAEPATGEEAASGAPSDAAEADAAFVLETMEDFEAWILQSDVAVNLLFLLRFGVGIVGLILLVVLIYGRYDRARAGLSPLPPRPPPTSPVTPLQALGAIVTLGLGGQFLAAGLLHAFPVLGESVVTLLVVAQLALLPLAVLVWVQRHRLRASPIAPPRPGLVGGIWAFCVASAFVLPAAMLSEWALRNLGRPIELQAPVVKMIEARDTLAPWLVTLVAVFVAPLLEESVFRGFLYPLVRGRDSSKRRAVAAALFVSALFALIHDNEAAFLPLFVLALVLTWVFERTNSLATVVVAHGLWNLASTLPLLVRMMT